ncbi:helix-turn-helix domain-containing protein [Pseudomonas prosekii]|uniref:helix-turn-helix domain-containing protein n=1 Tax=Pseudomonas prosekii TaxID=1148509 RepID=UPI003F750A3D
MKELAYIPFPRVEESPTSLMKRLAVHHGCVNRSQFRSLGVPDYFTNTCMSVQTELPQWVAARAGQHAQTFLSGFYQPTGLIGRRMPHQIEKLTVKFNLIRWTRTAFCSECWVEEYEHFIKDLKFSVNCPYHNCRYLTHCPQCGVVLRWDNPLIDDCGNCKTKLKSQVCSPEVAAPERYVLSLFRDSKQVQFDQLSQNLRALQFDQDHPGTPESRLILEAAISLVNEDVAGTKRFLETIGQKYPHIPNEAICAKLALMRSPTTKKACEAFCLGDERTVPTLPARPEKALNTTTDLNDPFYLTRSQVGAGAHLKYEVLDKVKAQTPHIWKTIGRIGVLNEAQVLDFFAKIKEIKDPDRFSWTEDHSMALPTAASNLGISLNCVRTLIAAGFLRVILLENREHRILNAELQEFSSRYDTVNLIAARSGRPRKYLAYFMRKLGIFPVVVPETISPILLRKSDGDLLLTALQNNSPVTKSNVTGKLAIDSKIPFDRHLYVTFKKASEFYELESTTLKSLVKAGILHTRKHPNFTSAIGLFKEELENIKKDYITTTTAAQIIGVTTKVTGFVLDDLGIHPVVGGPLDRLCPTALFSRQAVDNLVSKQASKQASKTEQHLTIQQASKKLHINNSTVYQLIKSGDLAAQCDSGPSLLFASREKVDKFSNTHADTITVAKWCGVLSGKVKKLLSGMGISAVGDVKHNGRTTFYRLTELEKAGIIYCEEANYSELPATDKPRKIRETYKDKHLAFLESLTPVSDCCKKFGISRRCFLNTFDRTKFTPTITIGEKNFLTPENIEKLSTFLSKYITISMANKIIGGSGMIFRLQKMGAIAQATQLPIELKGHVFFLRSDFNKTVNELKSTK